MVRPTMMYCYWSDIFISKWRTNNRLTKEEYYKSGRDLILEGLKKHRSLKEIIVMLRLFLDKIAERRKNKQGVYRSDCLLSVQSIFALLILKQYTEGDLIIELSIKPHKKLALKNR